MITQRSMRRPNHRVVPGRYSCALLEIRERGRVIAGGLRYVHLLRWATAKFGESGGQVGDELHMSSDHTAIIRSPSSARVRSVGGMVRPEGFGGHQGSSTKNSRML